jgi:hypothetical protein
LSGVGYSIRSSSADATFRKKLESIYAISLEVAMLHELLQALQRTLQVCLRHSGRAQAPAIGRVEAQAPALGPPIPLQIVEMHGGRIWFESASWH